MTISVKTKSRVIAGMTGGGLIALVLILLTAAGCQGNYGIIEDELVEISPVAYSSDLGTISRKNTVPKVPQAQSMRLVVTYTKMTFSHPSDTSRIEQYKEAEALYRAKDYKGAAVLFKQYVKQWPENSWGFYMLGVASKKADEHEQAINALNESLRLDPNHVRGWVQLGRSYLDAGQPAKAITAMDEALKLKPVLSGAERLKGRAYHQLGDHEKAIAMYRLAVNKNSSDGWALNNLALVHIEQQQYDDALPLLAKAVEILDDVPFVFNNLGTVLERKGYFEEAEEAFTAALKINPSYKKAEVNKERVAGKTNLEENQVIDLSALATSVEKESKKWAASW